MWNASTYAEYRIMPLCHFVSELSLIFANNIAQMFFPTRLSWKGHDLGNYCSEKPFILFFFFTCSVTHCLMFFHQPCKVINSIQVTGSSARNTSAIQTCTIFISSINIPCWNQHLRWVVEAQYVRNKYDARKALKIFPRTSCCSGNFFIKTCH